MECRPSRLHSPAAEPDEMLRSGDASAFQNRGSEIAWSDVMGVSARGTPKR